MKTSGFTIVFLLACAAGATGAESVRRDASVDGQKDGRLPPRGSAEADCGLCSRSAASLRPSPVRSPQPGDKAEPQEQDTAGAQAPLTLDQAAQWVQSNIRLPEEALDYGVTGIEDIVVGVTWDGRLFMPFRLSTLGAAYEEEIERVVASAPPCIPSAYSNGTKRFQVNFSALVPAEERDHIAPVKIRTIPVLNRPDCPPANSRERMLDWLYGRFSVPRSMKQYCDTVKISYTIDTDGRVANASVGECRDAELQKSLEAALRHAPAWIPAWSWNKCAVAIAISDRMIVRIDGGEKMPREQYLAAVYRNSPVAPDDPDVIVSNPDIPSKCFSKTGKEIKVDSPTTITATFIIEADGSLSGFLVQTPDTTLARKFADAILASNWSPAVQAGKAVRSAYRYTAKLSPGLTYRIASSVPFRVPVSNSAPISSYFGGWLSSEVPPLSYYSGYYNMDYSSSYNRGYLYPGYYYRGNNNSDYSQYRRW